MAMCRVSLGMQPGDRLVTFVQYLRDRICAASRRFTASGTVPDTYSPALHGILSAKLAHVSSMLRDFHLSDAILTGGIGTFGGYRILDLLPSRFGLASSTV